MKTRLLILALLTLPLSSRAQTAGAEALARVEPQAARWIDWQLRAASMESDFMEHVTRDTKNPGSFAECLASFDKNEVATVRRFNDWRGSKIAGWKASAAAGSLSPDEAARRAGYVERLYRIRMLMFYGDLAPRVIDSCSVGADGKPNGRLFAGPEWGIAAPTTELHQAENELARQSGLSQEDAFTH
jgi:hypothetical protein